MGLSEVLNDSVLPIVDRSQHASGLERQGVPAERLSNVLLVLWLLTLSTVLRCSASVLVLLSASPM